MSGFGLWQGVHASLIADWDENGEEIHEPLGKVMGFGTSNGQPVVLVALDEPVWTEGRKHFITVISVHESNLVATGPFDIVNDHARIESAATLENGVLTHIQDWGQDM